MVICNVLWAARLWRVNSGTGGQDDLRVDGGHARQEHRCQVDHSPAHGVQLRSWHRRRWPALLVLPVFARIVVEHGRANTFTLSSAFFIAQNLHEKQFEKINVA